MEMFMNSKLIDILSFIEEYDTSHGTSLVESAFKDTLLGTVDEIDYDYDNYTYTYNNKVYEYFSDVIDDNEKLEVMYYNQCVEYIVEGFGIKDSGFDYMD
jgi:hypothetical protein